jgi:hypothetical protein
MQELVPPIVPVPLAVLTDDPDLGLRQVAGPEQPETLVHAVHTSEMADPLPYLLGGELLLSAGVHCPAVADSGTGSGTDSGTDSSKGSTDSGSSGSPGSSDSGTADGSAERIGSAMQAALSTQVR